MPRSAWLRSLISCLSPARASVAVQNVIERLDSRRVGGTARKQVAIAGLGIEQGKQLVERDSARSAAPLRAPLPLLTPFACTIADFTVAR